ncbi:MAG: 16S rRNA (guanine(966)-N(2))-methyltransferase RsmD [Candidatus Dadabacteria bacterium]|nr:16S rRNA (guanine(966)-N(2))-methyltransferase RsmD [Candidatus Dadabacteria bacterium]
MRIITGSAKGRKIKTASKGVRPMTARVRKSVFDTLGDLRGAHVLDVFAGSGALGIECLSRGADSAVFVEKSPQVAEVIHNNIKQCGFEDRCELIRADYRKAAEILTESGRKFDLVFIMPPYSLYKKISESKLEARFSSLLSQNGRIVIEYETGGEDGGEHSGEKRVTKKYGGTTVSIISP